MTRPTTSVKLGLLSLEAREVPATAVLSGGILTITGNDTSETITVRQSATAITVDGFSGSHALGSVAEIRIDVRGGNDTVNLQRTGAVVTKPAAIWGGAGNDVIHGGNGADYLDGGLGNDILFGYGGADRLAGDKGDDVLFGGSQGDQLAGGDGKDLLHGVGGTDRMDGGRQDDTFMDAAAGENVHDDVWGTTVFGSGYTHRHILGVADRSPFGWFDESMNDDSLRRLAREFARDGSVDREEMLALFDDAGTGGTIDGVELGDLRRLTAADPVVMPPEVRDLAKKVVHGDRANQWFTGGKGTRADVGNLFAGTTDDHLDDLVDKWFKGTDRPMPLSPNRTTRFEYRHAAGELFVDGPSAADLDQGRVGDCYLLAGLGAVAKANPQRIRDMFIENPDGTVTVRFFLDGKAEFVTVDRSLPVVDLVDLEPAFAGVGHRTDAEGKLVRMAVDDARGELWVALAEKAYAQLSETGRVGRDSTNSYNGIGGPIAPGWDGRFSNRDGINEGAIDVGMKHVANADAPMGLMATAHFDEVRRAFEAGKGVTFGSWWSPPNPNVVGPHVYVMTGFAQTGSDPAKWTITVLNPHGRDAAQPHIQTLSWAEMQVNFGSWCGGRF